MATAFASQLSAIQSGFDQKAPEPVKTTIGNVKAELKASYNPSNGPQIGSTLPSFALPNAFGQTVTLSQLLSESKTKGVLITFYRGGWCPFCSVALHGLQEHSEEFAAAGVTLVAISPELPDQTLTTKEKFELKFEVLSDHASKYAGKLGLAWKTPDPLKEIMKGFGNDLGKLNGDETYTLPYASNILVDKEGKVRNTFVETDWSQRLDPATAVQWAQAL